MDEIVIAIRIMIANEIVMVIGNEMVIVIVIVSVSVSVSVSVIVIVSLSVSVSVIESD